MEETTYNGKPRNIRQELDQIRERIADPNFLANKGLSNEVGIHTFCYPPKDEIMVQEFVLRLVKESGIRICPNEQAEENYPQKQAEHMEESRIQETAPATPYRIIECDLYEIFLQLLKDKRVLDSTAFLEEKRGKDYLLKQLQKIATPEAFLSYMKYEPHRSGDVLFLTGVGKVYPFMRSHKMLDSMQAMFADIPIVMFYPGSFNGQDLSLFGEFLDGHYYRAFSLL